MSLKKIFKSDIHKKIIIFFHQNPSSVDTPRGVATWVNYDRRKVNTALKDLAKHKILNAHESESITGYSYTSDKKIMKQIDDFIRQC